MNIEKSVRVNIASIFSYINKLNYKDIRMSCGDDWLFCFDSTLFYDSAVVKIVSKLLIVDF